MSTDLSSTAAAEETPVAATSPVVAPEGSAAETSAPDWLLTDREDGVTGEQLLAEYATQLDTEAHLAIEQGEEMYVRATYEARMLVKRRATGHPDYEGDSMILREWAKARWETHLPDLKPEECVAVLSTATYAFSPSTGKTLEVAPELMRKVATIALPRDEHDKPSVVMVDDEEWLKIVADWRAGGEALLLLDGVRLEAVTAAMSDAGIEDSDLNPWAESQEVLRVRFNYWTDTAKRLGEPQKILVKGRERTVPTDPGDVVVAAWEELPGYVQQDRIAKMQAARVQERTNFARRINRRVMDRIHANISPEKLEAAGVKRRVAVKTLKPGEEPAPRGRKGPETTGVDGTHAAIVDAFKSKDLDLAERILILRDMIAFLSATAPEEYESLGGAVRGTIAANLGSALAAAETFRLNVKGSDN